MADQTGLGGSHNGRSPATIALDEHVGGRIKQRRKELGQSQAALAEALGLSFQQLQKYERAQNRTSAATLFRISVIQGVEIGYYFEGLPRVVTRLRP